MSLLSFRETFESMKKHLKVYDNHPHAVNSTKELTMKNKLINNSKRYEL